ncbi:MAG: hypothetical protein IPK03_13175 [Bacteroidetes bacterium]|nr:hypothetical protein [Bacteroidota bacterium]
MPKESKEVDLFVDSKPLTKAEQIRISQVIANFKRTGEKTMSSKRTLTKKIN